MPTSRQGWHVETLNQISCKDSHIHIQVQFNVPARLYVSNHVFLTDSGSPVPRALVTSLSLPVKALDGRLVSGGAVIQTTKQLGLEIEPAHHELLKFLVLEHSEPTVQVNA